MANVATSTPEEEAAIPAVCSWCKRIRGADGSSWVDPGRRGCEPGGDVVNTICPDCFGDVSRGSNRKDG